MNPNACLKSLNSNTRCRFPFTTLQPSSLRSPAAISCFDSFPLLMCPPVPRQLQSNRFFTRHRASHFGSSSALRLYFRREAKTRKTVNSDQFSAPRNSILATHRVPTERELFQIPQAISASIFPGLESDDGLTDRNLPIYHMKK